MRVTGGEWGGIPLVGPKDDAIRPTSDKARLAIFNSLLSGKMDCDLDGAIVLDGTAGTGAMGIEALSRGAAFCHFAEPARPALDIIRQNLAKVKVENQRWRLYSCKAQGLPQADKPVDLVFLDPPYNQNLLPEMLHKLREKNWVDRNTLLVLEEDVKAILTLPIGIIDRKEYGAAQVIYARMPV